MVGGGTRASRPTETKNDVPDEYLLVAVSLRADEERPYLFSQTLFLSLFNVISTEASAKRRNPPRLSPDNVSTIIFFDLFTRCGSGHSRKVASRHRQEGWRVREGGISFPRDCHASLVMTATKNRSEMSYTVIIVSTGIADLP